MKKLLFVSISLVVVSLINCSEFNIQICSLQSTRSHNEDFHKTCDFTCLKKRGIIAAVFDGHGGTAVALDLKRYFCSRFCTILEKNCEIWKQQNNNIIEAALQETFQECHTLIKAKKNEYQSIGSTCVTAVLYDGNCYFANLGDSRGYLRCGEQYYVTRDHKPNDLIEAEYCEKYEKTMPLVLYYGVWVKENRVMSNRIGGCSGTLSMTRAFGDFMFKNTDALKNIFEKLPAEERKNKCDSYLKQGFGGNLYKDIKIDEDTAQYYPLVREEPDITQYSLENMEGYIILASDGFWDVVENEEVNGLVQSKESTFFNFIFNLNMAKKLAEEAVITRKSSDNTTVMFIQLPTSEKQTKGISFKCGRYAIIGIISFLIIKYCIFGKS
jgi:serine/threonine protein phosphatase PrpC